MVEVEAELGIFSPGRNFLAHEKKSCNRNKFLFAGRNFFSGRKIFFLCQLIRIEILSPYYTFLLHLLQLFHMKSLSHPGQRLNSVILGEVSFLEKGRAQIV